VTGQVHFLLNPSQFISRTNVRRYISTDRYILDVHESLDRDTTMKITDKMHYID